MYERKKNEKYNFEDIAIKDYSKNMNKNVDNVHIDHRERVRNRFLKEGLDKFEEHNVLEMLLFYAIPRKDTNDLAHELVNKFGSLSGVFDAKFEDLCKVKGVGKNTAVLIKMMPQLFRKYETSKLKTEDIPLNSAELVAKYASKHYKGVTQEQLYLMCLDPVCNLISFTKISEGTTKKTSIDLRLISQTLLDSNASSAILVHNHPSGITAPSRADVDATTDIANFMERIGVNLSDHIIIGHGDDFFSFRRSDKWRGIFRR